MAALTGKIIARKVKPTGTAIKTITMAMAARMIVKMMTMITMASPMGTTIARKASSGGLQMRRPTTTAMAARMIVKMMTMITMGSTMATTIARKASPVGPQMGIPTTMEMVAKTGKTNAKMGARMMTMITMASTMVLKATMTQMRTVSRIASMTTVMAMG
jgi:hypothetical protein